MPNQWSLSAFGYELARRGLPLHYIRRVVGEFADHQADMAADFRIRADRDQKDTATRRIGNPSQLAEQIACNFRSPPVPKSSTSYHSS